jgi:dTDP-4-amino-4,6-dideoxygalactose transaminase
MIHLDDHAIRRYQELAGEVLQSGFLSEGEMTRRFEAGWERVTGLPAAAVSSGGFALWALLETAGVRGHDVVVPTNTFMATVLAVELAGGRVRFADCSRRDLCLDLPSLAAAVTPATRAVVVVHIGGHLAFDIEAIAAWCAERRLALIEDCAHAHGATVHGAAGGTFGLGGAYSFYATKTLPLGEGGMVVSRDPEVIEQVRRFRNYGKPDHRVPGFHGRLSELQAALGVVQLEQLPGILAWKRALARRYDAIFSRRVELPAGCESGYYKYIVFDTELRERTGAVYADLCHTIRGETLELPEATWVATHHACPPIWYGYPGAELADDELRARLLGPA